MNETYQCRCDVIIRNNFKDGTENYLNQIALPWFGLECETWDLRDAFETVNTWISDYRRHAFNMTLPEEKGVNRFYITLEAAVINKETQKNYKKWKETIIRRCS